MWKCFERMMVTLLRREVDTHLDSFQFAYKWGRSTDDAINSIIHLVSKHLDDLDILKAYASVLFIDFSSAFNKMQPQLLVGKLKEMNVNPYILRWYHSFLTAHTASQGQQLPLGTQIDKYRCPTGLCQLPGPLHIVHK